MHGRDTLVLAAVVAVCAPSPLALAGWPPGPRFESAGKLVERLRKVSVKAPSNPAPMTVATTECPDGEGTAYWEIGGHATGLVPAVFAAGPGTLSSESGAAGIISPVALDLVPAVPGFMRDDFRLRLAQLGPALQEEIATVLAALPVRHLDEATFLVAHLAVEDLTSEAFDTWILSETPADIYAAGQAGTKLQHVALLDQTSEDGGVDWTTVKLRMDDGTGRTVEAEVPRDVYYWYVVHPRLDLEPVQLTIPDTGKPAKHPEGSSWREYYLFTPDGVAPYTDHFLFGNPSPVSNAELQGWGPSAATVLDGLEVGPLELIRTPTGLAMIEFRVKSGTILATTMPLERAAAEGLSDLLTNCLYYGNGNVHVTTGMPQLVVQEHNPYGNNAIELAMNKLGIKFDTVDAAAFAGLELGKYIKIVVPSDQPRSLYEAVAARRDDLEAWIGTGRVFELHCATSAGEDWSGVVMPGGFTIAPADGTWASDSVETGGWPHLIEIIPGAVLAWDGQPYKSLSGDRFFDASAFALDRIGWFTSQNLFDNVAEYSKKHPFTVTERSVQAVRVLYNHYGNCGELQDVVTAAARSSLVPMRNVSNPNEDHVWNEFYSPLDGQWHTFQVSWSDGETIIDDSKGAAEKLTGGGKDISMVQAYRGDGLMLNRTAKYSKTWTLDMGVTDAAGRPLDGALVLVASEAYYPDPDGTYPLTIGYFGYTGAAGRFTAQLGDAQNFYVRVISEAGTYPPEPGKVAQVASVDEAVPGKTIELNAALDQDAVVRVPNLPATTPGIDAERGWMRLDLSAVGKYLVGTNPLSGTSFNERLADGGTFDAYVLDDEAFAAWEAGEPSTAEWGATGIAGDGTEICGPLPETGGAHLVFVAPEHLGIGTAFTGAVTLNSITGSGDVAGPDGPVDDRDLVEADEADPAGEAWDAGTIIGEDGTSKTGGDCSAAPVGTPGPALALCLAFGLALTFVRRRGRRA